MTKTLNERWAVHQERWEGLEGTPEANRDYAIRGDGAVVVLDSEGYFLIWAPPGLNGTIVLEAPDGTREDVYCEPIWLYGYYETLADLGTDGRWGWDAT